MPMTDIADLQLTTSGVWIDMPMTEEDKLCGPAAPYYSSTSAELRGLTLAQTLIRPVDDKKSLEIAQPPLQIQA